MAAARIAFPLPRGHGISKIRGTPHVVQHDEQAEPFKIRFDAKGVAGKRLPGEKDSPDRSVPTSTATGPRLAHDGGLADLAYAENGRLRAKASSRLGHRVRRSEVLDARETVVRILSRLELDCYAPIQVRLFPCCLGHVRTEWGQVAMTGQLWSLNHGTQSVSAWALRR